MAGTGHDIDEAASIARLMCRSPASVNTHIEFAKTEARALLANRAAAVLAVANALAERRTLSGTEIDRIVIRSKNR
jgi:ATP-dependent Zn protease